MPDQTLPTNLTISLRPEQYASPWVSPPPTLESLSDPIEEAPPSPPPLTIQSILESEDQYAAQQRIREMRRREKLHEPLPYPEGFKDPAPEGGRGVWGTYAPVVAGGHAYEKWTAEMEAAFRKTYAQWALDFDLNPDPDAPDQKDWRTEFKEGRHPTALDRPEAAAARERMPTPDEAEGLSLFELASAGTRPTGLTRTPEIPAPGDSLWAMVHNRKRQLEALPKGTGVPKNAAARALVRAVLPGGDSVAAATKFLSLADRALEIAAAPSDPEGDAFQAKLRAIAKEPDAAKRRAAAKKPVEPVLRKSKSALAATAAADLAIEGMKFPPVDYALRTIASGAAGLGAATKQLPERDIRAIHNLRNAVTGVNALRREQPMEAASARDMAVDEAWDDPHTRYRNETPLQKAENLQRGKAVLAGVSAVGDAPFYPLEEQPSVAGSLIERGFQMGPGEQALWQYGADPLVLDDLAGLPALAALAMKGPALAMAVGRKGLKGLVPRTGPSVEKALMSRFRGKAMTGEALHKLADQTAGAEGVSARMSDWLGERWETPVTREEFAGELVNDATRRRAAAPAATAPEIEYTRSTGDDHGTRTADADPVRPAAEKPDSGAGSSRGADVSPSAAAAREPTGPGRPAHVPEVRDVGNDYNAKRGLPPVRHDEYVQVHEGRGGAIAEAYEALPVDDSANPVVREAYDALAEEIQAQWDHLQEQGYRMEPWTADGQPYRNSDEMIADVRQNKHVYFFTGGGPHALFDVVDPATGLSVNDKFRAIHDVLGHAGGGYGFGARGEENAWRAHSQMFSDKARRAMTTETRGQNSWVNFGQQNYNPNGTAKNLPLEDRPFAPQKVAVLPDKYVFDARRPQMRKNPLPEDFVEARDQSARGGYLSDHGADELSKRKLYLSEDGTVGGALTSDGNMGNLFNNGGQKGAAREVLLDMLADGGKTAEAFDGPLTQLYAQFGLHETGRMEFDPAQAPKNWNVERDDHPDLVFLARTGELEHADDIRFRLDDERLWTDPREPGDNYYTDFAAGQRDATKAALDAERRRATQGSDVSGGVRADARGGVAGEARGESAAGGAGAGRAVADGPRTIQFTRNTESASTHGDFGETYGQHLEPAGRYINEIDPSADLSKPPEKGWERGTVTFEHPLVIDWGEGGLYSDPSNWKQVLSKRYDGKTGAALSKAIKADGYDGIITMDKSGATNEIVDLTGGRSGGVTPATAAKLAVAGTVAATADDEDGSGALLGAAVLGGKSGARLAATAKTAALTARKAAKTARAAKKVERTLGDALQALEGAYVTPERVRAALATVNPAEVRARGLEPWLDAYGTKPIPRAELVANLSGSETARVMDQLKGGAFTAKRAREVVTSVLGPDAVAERGLDKWFKKKRKNPLTRSQIEAELWKTEPGAPTPLAPTLAEAETQAQTTFGRGLEDLNDKELVKLVRATTGEDALYLMPPGARESWVKKQGKALAESVETGILDRTRPVIQGAQDPTEAMRIAEDYARTGDDAARDAALAAYPESVRAAVERYGVAQRRLDTLFGARGLRKDPIDGNLISTNVITSKKAKPQTAMRETNLESFPEGSEIEANTAKLMLESGILTDAEKAAATTPRQVIRASIDAMKRNLRALYEAYPQEWRERSRAWYQGAHRLAGEMAEEFGTTREQVAGVMASLSPTKDWFQNVELARRILTRVREFEKAPPVFTEALYGRFAEKMNKGTDFAISKTKSEKAAAGRKFTSADERRIRADRAKRIEKIRDLIGQSWDGGDIETKAFIFRAMEVMDFPEGQTFSVISPEGDVVRTATKKNGTDWKLVHQSYKFIGNAIEIAEMAPNTPFAQVMERVSAKLGGEHKVRSFYNNIINPWDKRSVTIDTHADAAAWLRPFSSKSAQVKQSMGGAGASKSATTGVSGTNGVIAQAYFELADEMKLARPSELQSVTWEAIRSLFEPSHKKVGGKAFTAIEDLHNQYISGKISHDKFFRFLKNTLRNADSHASGFRAPDWVTKPASDKGRLVAGAVSPRDSVFSAGPGSHRVDTEGLVGAGAPEPVGAVQAGR